jgi:hypothetical protein
MNARIKLAGWSFILVAALAQGCSPSAVAQSHPTAAATALAPSESDVADIQAQFLKLLRLSPVLTTVVARDPSLLSDQQYVARNNPELAQFMAAHPDIAKNPDFYLFSHLEGGHGDRAEALERAVWPDIAPSAPWRPNQAAEVVDKLVPLVGLPVFFFIVFLIVRLFVESRRWNRALKMQSEIHGRLIDKFSTSQDLAAYLETEAGQRFLAASPTATGPAFVQQMPNAVARILTPLTAGIVMVLAGLGLIAIRNSSPDTSTPLFILGVLALMPGIGFILSAAATWIVANRLGLLPGKEETPGAASAPINSHDRP